MNALTARTRQIIALALITAAVLCAVLSGQQASAGTDHHHHSLPAVCKAVKALPGYTLPGTPKDRIRGLISGREMIMSLRAAHVSRHDMILECTSYLYRWAADHPKAA